MKRVILIFLIFSKLLFCHHQDVHKYITWQAWQLVKWYHPGVEYSVMDNHVGHWQDGSLNGDYPWVKQKIITGAYREDEEDVVYNYGFLFTDWATTDTHFWDGFCQDHYDATCFHPIPYTYRYPNSYYKSRAFWCGQPLLPSDYNCTCNHISISYSDWLHTWFFQIPGTPWVARYRIHFNSLDDFYKNTATHAWVAAVHYFEDPWYTVNPPEPVNEWMSSYQIEQLRDRVTWEVVGRICHLIEDCSVWHNPEKMDKLIRCKIV